MLNVTRKGNRFMLQVILEYGFIKRKIIKTFYFVNCLWYDYESILNYALYIIWYTIGSGC